MQLFLLPIGLLALLVAADDAPPSDDLLNNRNGTSPCDMMENFLNNCNNSRARDEDEDDGTNFTRLTPTACSCTNMYFNLWNACVWTKTHLLNTTYESLQQKCGEASHNVTTLESPPAGYPEWACQEPSSNGTFNIVAAIETANATRPRKWSSLQIVLPILVGLIVAAGLALCFFFYRRRKMSSRQNSRRPWMQTTGNRPRFQFPTFSSATMVRELNRSSSWSIDEQNEGLDEYQFVSYPASLQGSSASGHVRLSSSSSATHPPGPPMLAIPAGKKPPVWSWPGKSIWKGPLQRVQLLSYAIPQPWRSTRRVPVKNIPSYTKFRVDASDSDSPLSRHPHTGSLLSRPERSRTNLNNETIFEREAEEDSSDSDEEALPLIPQGHSPLNHSAGPQPSTVAIAPTAGTESAPPNSSQRPARNTPPSSAPPRTPLPPPPPPPQQLPAQRSNPTPGPTSPSSPQQSAIRIQLSQASLPPAPTAPPPPPPPTVPRRSPRTPRTPLPGQPSSLPPLPSPPLPSPALSPGRQLPPPPSNPVPQTPRQTPRHRLSSDGGSSVRSLPFTPTPLYVRGAPPAPIEVLEPSTNETPPHSAPPYVRQPSLDHSHSPVVSATSPEAARSIRRLPLPPG
ncbi:hypothetical protein C8R43DRAFT_972638 [Mycena crocata]|nr:hypothetical protein C8R43DRAFT_972638 [Mycena crocata]